MTFDLFESAGVEVLNPARDPVSRRRRARSLLSWVERLTQTVDPTFHTLAAGVARRAELLGAHSVARAVRWYATPRALDRHGYDVMTMRLERITKRWVRRQERP